MAGSNSEYDHTCNRIKGTDIDGAGRNSGAVMEKRKLAFFVC